MQTSGRVKTNMVPPCGETSCSWIKLGGDIVGVMCNGGRGIQMCGSAETMPAPASRLCFPVASTKPTQHFSRLGRAD